MWEALLLAVIKCRSWMLALDSSSSALIAYCLISWAARGANMDTQNFNLCHCPSANNSADSTSETRLEARAFFRYATTPDSIQAKTRSIFSNFEFTQKRARSKRIHQIQVRSATFCGTGSTGTALPTSWKPHGRPARSGSQGTTEHVQHVQHVHNGRQNMNLGTLKTSILVIALLQPKTDEKKFPHQF